MTSVGNCYNDGQYYYYGHIIYKHCDEYMCGYTNGYNHFNGYDWIMTGETDPSCVTTSFGKLRK